MEVSSWRKRIDEVDRQILSLLNERAHCVLELAPLKRQNGIPIHEPEREKQVLANLRRHNRGPLSNDAACAIFERIMEVMRAMQEASEPVSMGRKETKPAQSGSHAQPEKKKKSRRTR